MRAGIRHNNSAKQRNTCTGSEQEKTSDKNNPENVQVFARCSVKLGKVCPEELFGEQMNQNDLEMSELLQEVSKLPDEEKNLVNGVMKEVLNYAKCKNSMNDTKSKK